MKVDTGKKNLALESLWQNPDQIFFLDANIFIPPDRRNLGALRDVSFSNYKDIFLAPLFDSFSSLAIHESVYDEIVSDQIKTYVDDKVQVHRLTVHSDNQLSPAEQIVYQSYIGKIAPHSQYDPKLGNAKDKGEVLSLAYMATKGYFYLGANDDLPIRLVNQASGLKTGLGGLAVIQSYELLYYFQRLEKSNKKGLKALYKYHYRLTQKESKENPEWGDFIQKMDELSYDDENTYCSDSCSG